MRFWDSSAIVALLVDERGSRELLEMVERDSAIIAWWGTPTECVSAIARREREGSFSAADSAKAIARLRLLAESWSEILASEQVRTVAIRLLRVHPLRSADSLQLGAAIVAADGEPKSLPFVCLDDRLRVAAEKEGFAVEPTGVAEGS
ncbi:MAG: type II toxin-antitoxin system VapC family toxin [Usitatibacter sp.]